jgi:WD40 repeat protein
MTAADPEDPVRADLADLIQSLSEAEFRVGTSEAIDATALLRAMGARGVHLEDPARLRSRLRPVFCKSADQQRAFDAFFDRWWSRVLAQARRDRTPEPEKTKEGEGTSTGVGRPPTSALWLAGVFWAIVVVAVAGYYYRSRSSASVTSAPLGVEVASSSPPPATPPTAIPPPTATPRVTVDRYVPATRTTVEIRTWWVWALAALPFAALVSVSLPVLVLSRTRLRRRSDPMFLDTARLAIDARRLVPPMQGEIGDRLARHVRSRGIDIERQARRPSLDIRRTIEATLRNHGVPTLRFSVARVHPSYLLLIDVAHETDPRGRLFFQWAERLQREGLEVELLLIRQVGSAGDPHSLRVCDPAVVQRGKSTWTSIRRLRQPPFGERLIVVSDGGPFVDEKGTWRGDAAHARFYQWRDRAIFTPIEPRDWGLREESLERAERVTDPGFIVLPLEESALAAWTDLVLTGQLSTVTLSDPQRFPALLRKGGRGRFGSDEPPPVETIERLIQQLHLYLGDRGFYWLAAIASTPVVRWELTLLLGRAVLERLPRLADQESLHASLARNYRRLVRLPWLQRESMPDWLRLRLLVELSQAQQAELRALVQSLLGKLSPVATPEGIRLEFERPPSVDRIRGGAIDPRAAGDPIYLGYMTGLSPDQLVLRAPREWASWAARIPLRREPGWRGALARLRARTRAAWGRWIWSRGLPYLGLNRRHVLALGLLALPLVVALAVARSRAPQSPLFTPTRFFEERSHTRVVTSTGVRTMAVSPMGELMAVAHEDRTIEFLNPVTGRLAAEPIRAQASPVTSLSFSVTGRLVFGDADGAVRQWASLGPATELYRVPGSAITAVAFDRLDAAYMAVGTSKGVVQVVDASQPGSKVTMTAQAHDAPVTSLAFHSHEARVASVGADRTLQVLDTRSGRQLGLLPQANKPNFTSVAFSSDSGRFVSGAVDGTLQLWDSQKIVRVGAPVKTEGAPVTRVAFTRDDARVISSSGSTLRVWHAQTLAPVGALDGHTGEVLDFGLTGDSQHLVSAGADGTLRFWDTQAATKEVESVAALTSTVSSLALSPDGRRLVSGGEDGLLRFWDPRTLQPMTDAVSGHTGRVNDLAFSPNSTRVASAGQDGSVRLWNAAARSPITATLQGGGGEVHAVRFSSDGRRLLSARSDGTLRLWDGQTGASIGAPLKGHAGEANALAVSSDGQRFASGGSDGTIRIWDAASTTTIATCVAHPRDRFGTPSKDAVWSVMFSDDGGRVFFGTSDGMLEVCNASNGQSIGQPVMVSTGSYVATPATQMSFVQTLPTLLKGSGRGGVASLSLTRKGRAVLAGSVDGRVRLFDTETLEPIGSPWDVGTSQRDVVLTSVGAYAVLTKSTKEPPFDGMQLWRINADPALASIRSIEVVQQAVLTSAHRWSGWAALGWLAGLTLIGVSIGSLRHDSRVERLVRTTGGDA